MGGYVKFKVLSLIIKARIDWLKELFKVVITVMVADVAGMSKLYLDNTIDMLFYMGAYCYLFCSMFVWI